MSASWGTISGSAYEAIYLFQGMRLDLSSGLYITNNRWYSVTLARWTRNDPLGFGADDNNLVRFIFNAPSSTTDPSGCGWKPNDFNCSAILRDLDPTLRFGWNDDENDQTTKPRIKGPLDIEKLKQIIELTSCLQLTLLSKLLDCIELSISNREDNGISKPGGLDQAHKDRIKDEKELKEIVDKKIEGCKPKPPIEKLSPDEVRKFLQRLQGNLSSGGGASGGQSSGGSSGGVNGQLGIEGGGTNGSPSIPRGSPSPGTRPPIRVVPPITVPRLPPVRPAPVDPPLAAPKFGLFFFPGLGMFFPEFLPHHPLDPDGRCNNWV
jgi:RHS repeat-associated protein